MHDKSVPVNASRMRIGRIHREIHYPYWATLAQGINARAAELGVELCLPQADPDDEYERAITEVVQQRPLVAILTGTLIVAVPSAYEIFAAASIPVLGAATEPSAHCASAVRADEAQGATMVVGELFRHMGDHGKVANICHPWMSHRQAEFHTLLPERRNIELAYAQQQLHPIAGSSRRVPALSA
jgi:ABC-type sugar transport system substrate-binding protein